MENQRDEIEIDLQRLFKALWRRAWVIIAAAFLCGGIAFSHAKLMITPMYRASTLMYVNNSTLSISQGLSISPGEIAAAQSLVDTYVVILKSRNTLNEVSDRADLDYSYAQLASMISAAAVNETEVFEVVVTGPDPQEAELIANTIAEVLPEKIADIVDGSSVRVVDYAIVPLHQSSPNVKRNAMMGALAGIALSCLAIVLLELFDTTIRTEEYLTQKYELPVLAVIPELTAHKNSGYGYYRKQSDSKKTEGEK